MKNKVHQFTWKIRKRFIKKTHDRFSSLEQEAYYMQHKINFARNFGGAKVVFVGDSNGENISYDDLSLLNPISINISKGGTRCDTWVKFFKSAEGILIRDQIKKETVIFNISGNHILQDSMDNFVGSFNELFQMFPDAWYITVPQIHSSLIAAFGHKKSQSQINEEIRFVNSHIKNKTNKHIDIFPLTTIDGEEAIFGVHEDFVHFSKEYDRKVRIPYIKLIVGI
jgi:hypothetical protein